MFASREFVMPIQENIIRHPGLKAADGERHHRHCRCVQSVGRNAEQICIIAKSRPKATAREGGRPRFAHKKTKRCEYNPGGTTRKKAQRQPRMSEIFPPKA